MSKDSSKREQIIEGLRELADFYEQHPGVPLPLFPSWNHCVLADNDDAGRAAVGEIAEALGVPVEVSGGSADADSKFGAVRFQAYYVSRQRSKNYADNLRFLEEHGRS